ncbi:MAG TPA: DUF5681 domain-containing protein [Gammaproteobacteria bacterium]|nr:DUF5681 domain-containing protein [Gammaproteobacteria bacterium]
MPYKKGQSGNPSGRPRGISDKRTALRELLAPHAQALIEKTVELAKGGDTTALRLCLERIMAPIRARDDAVVIEQVGNTLTERSQAIVNASLTGQISPSEASTLMQALATQARVIESEELAARIEALEEKLGISK